MLNSQSTSDDLEPTSLFCRAQDESILINEGEFQLLLRPSPLIKSLLLDPSLAWEQLIKNIGNDQAALKKVLLERVKGGSALPIPSDLGRILDGRDPKSVIDALKVALYLDDWIALQLESQIAGCLESSEYEIRFLAAANLAVHQPRNIVLRSSLKAGDQAIVKGVCESGSATLTPEVLDAFTSAPGALPPYLGLVLSPELLVHRYIRGRDDTERLAQEFGFIPQKEPLSRYHVDLLKNGLWLASASLTEFDPSDMQMKYASLERTLMPWSYSSKRPDIEFDINNPSDIDLFIE